MISEIRTNMMPVQINKQIHETWKSASNAHTATRFSANFTSRDSRQGSSCLAGPCVRPCQPAAKTGSRGKPANIDDDISILTLSEESVSHSGADSINKLDAWKHGPNS
jgi:hypothetical protein